MGNYWDYIENNYNHLDMSYIVSTSPEQQKIDTFSKIPQSNYYSQNTEQPYQFIKVPIQTDCFSGNTEQTNVTPNTVPAIKSQSKVESYVNSSDKLQQLQNIRNQNKYLQKLNIEANIRINQLENLDNLYQKQNMLLNCQIDRIVADNMKLTGVINEMKQQQIEMGKKFDTSIHQLQTCRHRYFLQVQKLKQKCKQYEYKLQYQISRADNQLTNKNQPKTVNQNNNNNSSIKNFQQSDTHNKELHKLQSQLFKQRQRVIELKQMMKNDQKEWLKCRQQWNQNKFKYQSQIYELCESNKTLNDSLGQIFKKYHELQQKIKQSDTIRIDNNLLELQLSQLKKQISNYDYDLAFAEQRIQELMEQVDNLEKQNEHLEDKIASHHKNQIVDDSEQLISEIDSIGKQIGQLKEQFYKLNPNEQSNKHKNSKDQVANIKKQLGVLINNPGVKKLLNMINEYQLKLNTLSNNQSRGKSKSIFDEQTQIYKQMQNLIEDVVSQLNDQKRSRRILEETVVHLQSEINSYKSSSYQQIPSRLSLVPLSKSMKYDDLNELSFKKNSSYQVLKTQSSKLIDRNRSRLQNKKNSGSQSHLSLIIPTTRSLRNIIQNYVSKQALLKIMYRITSQVQSISKNQKVNISSEHILISGYQSLNPERIQVQIQNIQHNNSLYMSPEILLGQSNSIQTIVWSLGILFDEMVHKKHFFTNQTQIKNPHYKYVFKSFSFRQLKPLISNCLQKDKFLRPSIKQILQNLYEIELNTY